MISNKPDKEILEKMMAIAESFFGTEKDPEQIAITMDSWNKLQAISDSCLFYEQDDNGNLISEIVVIPTTVELMNKFINKEINEQQLLDLTKHQDKYSALYLCSAITTPQYHRKGHATKLFKEALNRLPLTEGFKLFVWPTTEEGENMTKKLSSELNREILVRKH